MGWMARRNPHRPGRVEPDRLRLPPHPPRGLPLWFPLAVHGVRAYTEAIEAAISLARRAADEIACTALVTCSRRGRDPGDRVAMPRAGTWGFAKVPGVVVATRQPGRSRLLM